MSSSFNNESYMDADKALSKGTLPKELGILFAALDATASAIVITDNLSGDQPVIFCNAAFENLTGYRLNEIIGKNCRFLQGPDTSENARNEIREALRKDVFCLTRLLNYRKDGTTFFNEVKLFPFADGNGKITHYIGTQTPIYLNAGPYEGRQVGDGTTELISHELRTPLTNLKGSVQLLTRIINVYDNQDKHKMLINISQINLERLINVIERLLKKS